MKPYIQSLKQVRKTYIEKAIQELNISNDVLESEEGKIFLRETIEKFDDALINLQNYVRGKGGEGLAEHYLANSYDAKFDDIIRDKKVFKTPYGLRRVDAFWSSKSIAIESKMGYVSLSSFVKAQIRKDSYLLKRKIFSKVVWILFQGGSRNLQLALTKNGIEYQIGWFGIYPDIFSRSYSEVLPLDNIIMGENRASQPYEENYAKAATLILDSVRALDKESEQAKIVIKLWKLHVSPIWKGDDQEAKKKGILNWLGDMIKNKVELKNSQEIHRLLTNRD
jgi:hypothetical protein